MRCLVIIPTNLMPESFSAPLAWLFGRHADKVHGVYANQLTVSMGVTRRIAEVAMDLRAETPSRLPLIDAIIAATASHHGAVLVHRDPHFRSVPKARLNQISLP